MTNGAGVTKNLYEDLALYDELPPQVKRVLQDAPINLTASSAARLRYKYDADEIVLCVGEFINDYMHGTQEGSTLHTWTYVIKRPGVLKVGLHRGQDHPQAQEGYPWKNYQLEPKRTTRAVRITARSNRGR